MAPPHTHSVSDITRLKTLFAYSCKALHLLQPFLSLPWHQAVTPLGETLLLVLEALD